MIYQTTGIHFGSETLVFKSGPQEWERKFPCPPAGSQPGLWAAWGHLCSGWCCPEAPGTTLAEDQPSSCCGPAPSPHLVGCLQKAGGGGLPSELMSDGGGFQLRAPSLFKGPSMLEAGFQVGLCISTPAPGMLLVCAHSCLCTDKCKVLHCHGMCFRAWLAYAVLFEVLV